MKLFKSFALLGLGAEAVPTRSDASGGLCKANSQENCTGLMCQWGFGGCSVVTGASFQNSAIQSQVNMAMAGMAIPELQSEFGANKQALQSAGQSDNMRSFNLNFATFGAMGGMMPGMNMMAAMPNANNFFTCPIDVPFCERTACVDPQFDNMNTSKFAHACYSQPGCCFDATLYQYRVAFGDQFYQSVPTCFRAIDNQLFNQLAAQTTNYGQFQPAFVQPLVDQVLQLMDNDFMKMSVRQFQGCSARHGTPDSYNFIQRVGSGNYMVMSFVTDEAKYNDFVSTLTQSCGWNGITENECVLRGCCWNDASNSCENPLGNNITNERINSAIQYMLFKQSFGGSSGGGVASTGGTPPIAANSAPVPIGGGAPPPFAGLLGRKRREASEDESRSGLLSMMMGGNMGGNLMGGMGGFGGMAGMMGGMAGMMGGTTGGGGVFGGRTIGQNEMCPATQVARNCMSPSTINSFDIMQKMLLERHCAAKECCWDNDRYQKSMFIQNSGQTASTNLLCPWHAPDYSMYNMPSLAYSLRGCCDYSPCVERTGRDGTHIPKAPTAPQGGGFPSGGQRSSEPMWSNWGAWSACSQSCDNGLKTRMRTCPVEDACMGQNFEEQTCFTNCDPVVWTTWNTYGCSKTCGGGYETIYRSCISGPCPTPQEVRHNQPCNTEISCGGGWRPWNFFG